MVGECGAEQVVGELPVEAGHVAGNAGEVLEAALGGPTRAVTAELRDPDSPGTAQACRLKRTCLWFMFMGANR